MAVLDIAKRDLRNENQSRRIKAKMWFESEVVGKCLTLRKICEYAGADYRVARQAILQEAGL